MGDGNRDRELSLCIAFGVWFLCYPVLVVLSSALFGSVLLILTDHFSKSSDHCAIVITINNNMGGNVTRPGA